jgi:hypothetical protein
MYRIEDLKFPHRFWNLRNSIEIFTQKENPETGHAWLHDLIEDLAEMGCLSQESTRQVGVSLRDELEAVALDEFGQVFRQVVDGSEPFDSWVAWNRHPLWADTVKKARRVVNLMHEPQR